MYSILTPLQARKIQYARGFLLSFTSVRYRHFVRDRYARKAKARKIPCIVF